MGVISNVRRLICLCVIIMCFGLDVSGDCSGGHLTLDGGAAQSDKETYGCRSGCPTTGRQVHIIAQTGGNSYGKYPNGTKRPPEVYIDIKDECPANIPPTLVLIHNEVIYWIVQYQPAQKLLNLNVVVYTHLDQTLQIEGVLKETQPLLFNINELGKVDIPSLQWNQSAVSSIVGHLHTKHGFTNITSINVADRPDNWMLRTANYPSRFPGIPLPAFPTQHNQGACVQMLQSRLPIRGGAARAVGETTYGCRGECPSQGSQVHVIAQTQEIHGIFPEVSVHITEGCTVPVPIQLILISHSTLQWRIGFDQTLLHGSARLENVIVGYSGQLDIAARKGWPKVATISKVHCIRHMQVYKFGQSGELEVGGIFPEFRGKGLSVYLPVHQYNPVTIASEGTNHQMPMVIPKPLGYLYNPLQSNPLERLSPYSSYSAVHSVIEQLKQSHGFSAVTSFNIADWASTWTLSACCGSETPITHIRPAQSTTSSEVDQSSSSSTTTDSIIASNKPQAGEQESTNIPLVAGLVSLLVVVAAVIAGVAFCLYRQKSNSSLNSGTSPSTDPNIYSESPTVTDSNGITRDDRPPSYGEVEYEEAATVTPPVIPPRANRS